jgi:deoxyribonuclease-4
MSVAGGLHLAWERISRVRGQALQIFTKNQVQWRSPPLEPQAVERFRRAWAKAPEIPVAAHAGYLINLAAAEGEAADRSVSGFAEEIRRASILGIPYLIAHPGSHGGRGVAAGLARVVHNLDRAMNLARCPRVTVLLETTAGQGTGLGARFEEIAVILRESRFTEGLGVCLDTCHVFAAGYDIRNEAAYRRTMAALDRAVGMERVRFLHLNDSLRGLGSRVDRHTHIGQGAIGIEGFRLLLNDPCFVGHPMVLETPKGKTHALDRRNLRVLRGLMAAAHGRQESGRGQ